MVYTVARGVDNNLLVRIEKWVMALPVILAGLTVGVILLLKPGATNNPGARGGQDGAPTSANTAQSVNIRNTSQKSPAVSKKVTPDSQSRSSEGVTRNESQPNAGVATLAQVASATKPEVGGTGGDSPTTSSSGTASSGTTGSSTDTGSSSLTLPLTICLGTKDAASSGSLLNISTDHICIN